MPWYKCAKKSTFSIEYFENEVFFLKEMLHNTVVKINGSGLIWSTFIGLTEILLL